MSAPIQPAPRDEHVHPRAWVPLVVAWVLFLVPLGIFAALAEDVREHEGFAFDRPLLLWLHGLASPATGTVMQVITQLSGPVAVPVVSALVAAVLWWRGRRASAAVLAGSVVGSALLNTVLKLVFRRDRPDLWEHLVVENSYSFPSGHAMASASLAAACVVLVWHTQWRRAAVGTALVYVPAVGISRMYLGVHYPSDVLGGWCAAAAWVGVVAWVLRRSRSRRRVTPRHRPPASVRMGVQYE